MYIDRIYTKLYSNKDWNGLEQLVSEIRQFAMSELNRNALNAKVRLARKGKLDPFPGNSSNTTNYLVNRYIQALEEGDFDAAELMKDEIAYDHDDKVMATDRGSNYKDNLKKFKRLRSSPF